MVDRASQKFLTGQALKNEKRPGVPDAWLFWGFSQTSNPDGSGRETASMVKLSSYQAPPAKMADGAFGDE